jgi:hypothetical protein
MRPSTRLVPRGLASDVRDFRRFSGGRLHLRSRASGSGFVAYRLRGLHRYCSSDVGLPDFQRFARFELECVRLFRFFRGARFCGLNEVSAVLLCAAMNLIIGRQLQALACIGIMVPALRLHDKLAHRRRRRLRIRWFGRLRIRRFAHGLGVRGFRCDSFAVSDGAAIRVVFFMMSSFLGSREGMPSPSTKLRIGAHDFNVIVGCHASRADVFSSRSLLVPCNRAERHASADASKRQVIARGENAGSAGYSTIRHGEHESSRNALQRGAVSPLAIRSIPA